MNRKFRRLADLRTLTSSRVSLGVAILIAAALLVWAFVCQRLLANPRGDVETGLFCGLMWLYARVVHRLSVEGLEHVPQSRTPGPLIVVANHTAGVDPLLVQSLSPFAIRWMMAADMRLPQFDPFWRWTGIITVNRFDSEVSGTREAIRHVKGGGVLGIFPEGGIERPPKHILPFYDGVGLIVRATKAPVLPVLISGTPTADPAWASLYRPSRARVRFLPPIEYSTAQRGSLGAKEITRDLRERFIEGTGWPPNDDPRPLEELIERY